MLFRHRHIWLLVTVMTMVTLLVACGGQPASEPTETGENTTPTTEPAEEGPQFGGTLRIAYEESPPSMDLHWTTALSTMVVTTHVVETLFAFDASAKIYPMLATGYEVSPDSLTYVIGLREGVPFHNGEEMTSEDVVASLNRWMVLASDGKYMASITDSLEATGKYEVTWKLTQPMGTFISALAEQGQGAGIYPKELVDEVGTETEITHPVGTGPYEFVEHIPDRWIKLKRFDDYAALDGEPHGYAGKKVAYADEIMFIPVTESGTRLAGVQSGEYDFVRCIPGENYDQVQETAGIHSTITPFKGMRVYVFNKQAGPMSDKRVRQAFVLGLDVGELMKLADPRLSMLNPSLMPTNSVWYSEAGAENYNQHNIEQAKALLEEAGYNGEQITWLTTQPGYDGILAVEQQLEPLGFNFDVQVLDSPALVDKRKDPNYMDIFRTGNTYGLDPTSMIIFKESWPSSAVGWKSAEKDDLFAQLNTENDFDTRYAIWEQLQALFWEDVPAARLWDYAQMHVMSDKLQGYQNMVDPTFWNVWIKTE